MASAHRCAALLVAAPASGQGKTTVASALARLHARAGARVRAFKCGPDFLDPQWLALASGAEVDSLDLWINGPADCARRLAAAAADSDLLVVEGVMGLFDGQPSAADLAQRFGLPVLAVIDASAMAGTFGALAHGLADYRPDLPWLGVLANRVAGERHAQMLQAGLRRAQDWCGALPRNPAFSLPERHLGLQQAAELGDALARLDAAADALAATPLGQRALGELPAWQPAAEPLPATAQDLPPLLAGRRIAIARDAAFAFLYPANLALLRALGAELSFFSPLAGEPLPPCDALWLPGGYPELHAGRLAANARFRRSLRAFAETRPVHGECGGYMALGTALTDAEGVRHEMVGLLGLETSFARRRMHLGYRLAELAEPMPGHAAGARLRGHEFHYSTILAQPDTALAIVRDATGAIVAETGSRRGRATGTFFHLIAEDR